MTFPTYVYEAEFEDQKRANAPGQGSGAGWFGIPWLAKHRPPSDNPPQQMNFERQIPGGIASGTEYETDGLWQTPDALAFGQNNIPIEHAGYPGIAGTASINLAGYGQNAPNNRPVPGERNKPGGMHQLPKPSQCQQEYIDAWKEYQDCVPLWPGRCKRPKREDYCR